MSAQREDVTELPGLSSDELAGVVLGPTGRPVTDFPEPAPLRSHGQARIIALCNPKGGGGTTTTGSSGSCQVEATDDPTIGVTIELLVDVDLCVGGALSGAVCSLLGPTEPLEPLLGALVGEDGAVNVLLGALGGSFSADLCGGRPVVPVPGGTSPSDRARRVTVEARWGERDGQTVTLTTIVPRPAMPIQQPKLP